MSKIKKYSKKSLEPKNLSSIGPTSLAENDDVDLTHPRSFDEHKEEKDLHISSQLPHCCVHRSIQRSIVREGTIDAT